MIRRADVDSALAKVRDPELDRGLLELGFVGSVDIDADTVEVHLRLPTYFCAQNFAYLMVSDAKAALQAVSGVREAVVILDDHCASEEINRGVAADLNFEAAFGDDETDGGLEELRLQFLRKGLQARQERVCVELLRAGHTPEELAAMSLADLAPSPELEAYVARRCELGLDAQPEASLLITEEGGSVTAAEAADHLMRTRLVSLSLESNTAMCLALLDGRYGTTHGITDRITGERIQEVTL